MNDFQKEETATKDLRKQKILVVEDEINLLEGVCDILKLENFEVLTAENGMDALEILRQQVTPPDLILSDIMMPKMGGLQLLQEVRKQERWLYVPFIFLTARGEKVDVIKAKELGVDDYIVKPYDPYELLIAVRSRLQRYHVLMGSNNEKMTEMKRSILTILNHEFRTPLTFVVAYSDMLNQFVTDNLSDEEARSFLQGVTTGADRLRRLIENFILLVELESKEARETFEWRKYSITDVSDIFAQAWKEVETREGVTHTCTMHIPTEFPAFVGDQEYLKRALAQLMDNGVKFSKDASSIEAGVTSINGEIRLWVKDQGRGIPVEEQNNILQSFYQINRPLYEDQGAGSGLAIVKGVVHLHGGKLEIDSKAGEGSTFTMVIPCTTSSSTPQ